MVILMIIIRNKNDKKHTHKVKIDLFQGLILGDKRAKKFRQCPWFRWKMPENKHFLLDTLSMLAVTFLVQVFFCLCLCLCVCLCLCWIYQCNAFYFKMCWGWFLKGWKEPTKTLTDMFKCTKSLLYTFHYKQQTATSRSWSDENYIKIGKFR